MDHPTTPPDVVDNVRMGMCAQGRLEARRPPTAPAASASDRAAEARRTERRVADAEGLASNCQANGKSPTAI